MELIENKNVWFEKTSHSYTNQDGELLIGLTSLMAKHGLGADYSGIPAERLKQAATEGTAIHEYLQGIDEGTEVFADSLADEYLEAIRERGIRHLCSELLVSDNKIVATFIDKVYETGIPNTVDLADVKTTYDYHRRALEWQLGVDKVLFEAQNLGVKVRDVFCIHIDKKARKLKGIIPVNPVSREEVLALLECERKGLIYVDENNVPDISDALQPDEAYDLVNNAGKIAELENTIKVLKETSEKVRDKLLDYMEKNNLESVSFPGGSFKRKAAYTTTRIDSDALKKLFPSVYERVQKTSKVRASLTYKPNNQ